MRPLTIWGTYVQPVSFFPLTDEDDPDLRQSTTACCPRETIPDSCSCLDGCRCECLDCDCGLSEEDE